MCISTYHVILGQVIVLSRNFATIAVLDENQPIHPPSKLEGFLGKFW